MSRFDEYQRLEVIDHDAFSALAASIGDIVGASATRKPDDLVDALYAKAAAEHLTTPGRERIGAAYLLMLAATSAKEHHCDDPDCTGPNVAFVQQSAPGEELEVAEPDQVPEPLRTIGRLVGSELHEDHPMVVDLLLATPDDQIKSISAVLFDMAVASILFLTSVNAAVAGDAGRQAGLN